MTRGNEGRIYGGVIFRLPTFIAHIRQSPLSQREGFLRKASLFFKFHGQDYDT